MTNEDIRKRTQQLIRLGEQIQDLLDFVASRHNVHGNIKKKANAISNTYNRLLRLEENLIVTAPQPPKSLVATQTSSKFWIEASVTPVQK